MSLIGEALNEETRSFGATSSLQSWLPPVNKFAGKAKRANPQHRKYLSITGSLNLARRNKHVEMAQAAQIDAIPRITPSDLNARQS